MISYCAKQKLIFVSFVGSISSFMSSMEPDVRDFLIRVVWSITLIVVYMIIISTVGIAGGWLFFYDTPGPGNYIFYSWVLLSTVGAVLLLRKWWKKKFPHG